VKNEMKILGQEVERKQLASLIAVFGAGILVTLAFQKRAEIREAVRKVLEKS
jgi:hypothetical protein